MVPTKTHSLAIEYSAGIVNHFPGTIFAGRMMRHGGTSALFDAEPALIQFGATMTAPFGQTPLPARIAGRPYTINVHGTHPVVLTTVAESCAWTVHGAMCQAINSRMLTSQLIRVSVSVRHAPVHRRL